MPATWADRHQPTRQLTKRCSRPQCGRVLPATPEHFHRNRRGVYGLDAWCKRCKVAAQRLRANADLRHKARGRARYRALTRLREAHPGEFDRLFAAELEVEGLSR